jgi:hypothetical protein
MTQVTIMMRTGDPGLNRRGVWLALAPIIVILSACDVFGPRTESFIIRVDSIDAPATVAQGQAFDVVFSGGIGSDGCSTLARVDRTMTVDTLRVRFHGERRRGGNCPQMPTRLEHTEPVTPPVNDPFVVIAIQPTGPPLITTVRTNP